MSGTLVGRAALITGGATGIGRAAALRFAAQGARVVILDVNEEEGTRTAREAPDRITFQRCDVTAESEVAASVRAASQHLGTLHVLVTAAGILQGAYTPVDELELATFARVLDVNVLGTFLACRHAAPLLEASGGGVILCIASGAGVRGPSSSLAYGASKAGVQGFCHTLERQLAPRGIRVHVVCPGAIDTPLKRQNVLDGAAARGADPAQALAEARLGDPDGVARVLAFLASPDAEYVQGTVFTR